MAKSKLEVASQIAVVVIALSALVVSVWQMQATQKHNRLSVRPFIDYHIVQNRDTTLSVLFSNEGLGPALIQKITYSYENQSYDHLGKLLNAMGIRKEVISMFNYDPNTVVSNDDQMLLLKLMGTDHRDVTVRIEYRCIYEEEFSITFGF